MGFYADRVLPHLIQLGMRQELLLPIRRRLANAARGRVLEIGIGAGLNLPLYGAAVTEVIGLDSSRPLLDMASSAASRAPVRVRLHEASADCLPFHDGSVDTVVSTWTLCSIADVRSALDEARRVLSIDGRFLFAEHGLAPDTRVQQWQHRLTPVWKRIAGGCHLDRDIRALIEGAGFTIERLDTAYLPGPKFMTFTSDGCARPR
jgi:ubiquinone/menaquinone biosynthesis C-methylase UbiE